MEDPANFAACSLLSPNKVAVILLLLVDRLPSLGADLICPLLILFATSALARAAA